MPLLFSTISFSLQGFDFFVGFFLYFSIFCVVGWVIEMGYLATSGRGLINSGFLQGPVCPAYAAGACIIYPCIVLFAPLPLWLQFVLYAIFATILEYVAHISLEKTLGIRIWDYSDEFMNFQGRISLKYSVLWLVVIVGFVVLLHPLVIFMIESIPATGRYGIALFFIITLPLDYLFSAIIYNKMLKKVTAICTALNLPATEMKDLQFNRPRIMNEKKRLAKLLKDPDNAALTAMVEKKLFEEDNFDTLGFSIADYTDIIDHPRYAAWRTSSEKRKEIFRRYVRIAELSHKFCTILSLDARSAARGILLAAYQSDANSFPHRLVDFFFPQWRIELAIKRDFGTVNKTEIDVILRYKWPLNFTAPLTLECLAVSFAEKLIQSREFRQVLRTIYSPIFG